MLVDGCRGGLVLLAMVGGGMYGEGLLAVEVDAEADGDQCDEGDDED